VYLVGQWHNFMADAELGLGHFDAVIEESSKAIEAGYRVFYSYLNLAAAHALKGDIDEAKTAFAEARRLNPNSLGNYSRRRPRSAWGEVSSHALSGGRQPFRGDILARQDVVDVVASANRRHAATKVVQFLACAVASSKNDHGRTRAPSAEARMKYPGGVLPFSQGMMIGSISGSNCFAACLKHERWCSYISNLRASSVSR